MFFHIRKITLKFHKSVFLGNEGQNTNTNYFSISVPFALFPPLAFHVLSIKDPFMNILLIYLKLAAIFFASW